MTGVATLINRFSKLYNIKFETQHLYGLVSRSSVVLYKINLHYYSPTTLAEDVSHCPQVGPTILSLSGTWINFSD